MKLTALLVLLVPLGALSGCQKEEAETPEPARPVRSIVVEVAATQAASFTGTVDPQVRIDYSFQLLGRMVARPVDVGDAVEEGTLLASLDASVQEQGVRAAEASLAGAQASLSNATGVASRQEALQSSNVATQAAVDSARQALQSARSAVLQAQATLDKEREQLSYARLAANGPGIVTAVSAEPGTVVSPAQTIVTVARPDRRDAVIDLPEAFANTLSLGIQVPVTLEQDPGATASGSIREIAPLADPVTRTRRVKIALSDPPDSFRLGSIVRVSLSADAPDALVVPNGAILERDGDTFAWVLPDDADVATLRPVEAERRADGRWTVRDGLKAGERIAAAGVRTLAEGQRIKVERTAP